MSKNHGCLARKPSGEHSGPLLSVTKRPRGRTGSLRKTGKHRRVVVSYPSHADQLAERIVQLGGEPNLFPEELLSRSYSEYVEGESLVEMITEDLIAKRIAIDSYREMVTYVGTDDPATCKILEGIRAQEEKHAETQASLLPALVSETKSHRAGS